MMGLDKTYYCEKCERVAVAHVIEREAEHVIKGEKFIIQEKVVVCECGQELFDEEIDGETYAQLIELYDQRVGMSPLIMKEIREGFGLSMEQFSRILGWSKTTIVRYENNQSFPDASHLSVLKSLKESPELMRDFFEKNKSKFNSLEKERIAKALSHVSSCVAEDSAVYYLDRTYRRVSSGIDTGYGTFDYEKVKSMVAYFCRQGVLKTVLMKHLFYADFLNFKRHTVSMSGLPYIKLKYGPVPHKHEILVSHLEDEKVIEIDRDYDGVYERITISSTYPFDEALFTEKELEILSEVSRKFKDFGSVQISDFSHQEIGWKNTALNELISYENANTLILD